jgi:hypothetical protein
VRFVHGGDTPEEYDGIRRDGREPAHGGLFIMVQPTTDAVENGSGKIIRVKETVRRANCRILTSSL